MQYVGFRLADQEYAFRIEQIQEIVIPDRVTRMPQVPDYVEGVSNLRGTIIPIINLRRLFDLEAEARNDETRTIVANVPTIKLPMIGGQKRPSSGNLVRSSQIATIGKNPSVMLRVRVAMPSRMPAAAARPGASGAVTRIRNALSTRVRNSVSESSVWV